MTVDELVRRFSIFDEWEERYAYLIDLGRKLPLLADEHHIKENLVEGCLSQVWLVCTLNDDNIVSLQADSDSAIVKGLIGLVLMIYEAQTPTEILTTDLSNLFGELKLDSHLSANRRNGFMSMIGTIQSFAHSHQ
jgi:cysteine desulfuration protein SufE